MARKQTEEKSEAADTKPESTAAEGTASEPKARKGRGKKGASEKAADKSGPKTKAKVVAEAAPAAVSKTQAVKDYFAAHPEAGPTAVSQALKAQGVDITPNYVSLIKTQMKKKTGRASTKAAGKQEAPSATSEGLSIELLVKAKHAAAALGGVEAARAAIAALARLMD